MTIPYLIENSLEGSFAVTSEFIQIFCERIRSITAEPITLTVQYSSGHTEQYVDEASFLKSPWLHAHVVKSITIDSGSYGETTVQLRFSDFLFPKVSIRISGVRDRCLSVEAEILAIIGSIKTYVAPIHSSRFNGVLTGGVAAVLGIAIYEYSRNAIASVFLMFGIMFITINLIIYLIPKYEIQIGKGKKSATKRRILATFVFSFFILSGLGSIYQDAVVKTFKNAITAGQPSSAHTSSD